MPSDRSVQPRFTDAVQNAVLHVQQWYATQLDGYTFMVEEPTPLLCNLSKPADYYEGIGGWGRVIWGLQHCAPIEYPSDEYVWVVYPDVDFDCDGGGELGAGGHGVTILHRGDLNGLVDPLNHEQCGYRPRGEYGWIGGLAHELGHAFGAPHPPGCDEQRPDCDSDALMWFGFYDLYPDTHLTEEDQTILRASPFIHLRLTE